jgi:hypothetical protein
VKEPLSYKCVDCILNLFYGYYPYGANYFTLTYKLNFEAKAWEIMFDFMMDEKLIEPWGDGDKQIITEKGILLIKEHCGIQKYIERIEKKKKSITPSTAQDLHKPKKQKKVLPSKIIKPQPMIVKDDPLPSWIARNTEELPSIE